MAQQLPQETKSAVSRRKFMNAAAGISAATVAGCAGGKKKVQVERRVLGANDRINVGIIGCGGMGRNHMNTFKELGAQFVGVCDVYENNLNEGMKIAGSTATAYNEHERLLERKDLDAVIIASPEHWHHDHLIDVLAAGKDAYCEKPMCWSIRQGGDMVKAVRASKSVVQVGMQRRSSPKIREIKETVFDKKLLGDIYLVRAEWYWDWDVNRDPKLAGKLDWNRFCGPAGKQEFEPIKFRHWRYYWPFSGGNETDQGTHLMDVVQWMMGVDAPISAVQYGDCFRNKPTETPDTFCCTFEYPNFMTTWTLCYATNRWRNGWSITFQGTKGSLFLTEAGYRIFDQINGWENGLPKPVKEDLPGGLTHTKPHIQNFLDCMRSRQEPNAPVEIGHKAVRPLHLANAALKANARAKLAADGVGIIYL